MPTWTHEQTTGSPGTTPVAFASNVKQGSLLIAMVVGNPVSYDGVNNIPTDTRLTSYAFIEQVNDTTNGMMAAWYWGIAPTAGANTVSIVAAPNFDAYLVSEFSVDSGTITLDVHTGQTFTTPGTGTDQVTSGSVTPNGADALILGFAAENRNASTLTEGTNFALAGSTNLEGFAGNPVKIEYRTLASPASVAATWTQGTNEIGNALVAAFLATGGAPAADTTTRRYQIRRSRMTSW